MQWHAGKVQLTSAPETAPIVERFLGLEATSRLSRAALETLAIIAYQQPVTRPEIDAIRGVNSDGVLKSLLSKGLIQEAGRAERAGRPILYQTTSDFLGYFGLSSLNELPPLAPIEPLHPEDDHPVILKT
jgi:segregation and condensation protein B